MPIYPQFCPQCLTEFEILRLSARDESPRPCPNCHRPDTIQLLSTFTTRMSGPRFDLKRGVAHNPYENLTLDHIRDEGGKPLKVNSEAELHAAEKRYGFVHAATWGLQDQPPQHDPDAGQIHCNYKKKFNHDPSAYGPDKVAESLKETGYAGAAAETLADRPNSTKEVGK